MRESFLHSITSSVFWKGLSAIAALAKQIVIAATLGLSAQLDIYYMMIAFLGVLVFSWADMMDFVAVPNMVKANEKGRQAFNQLSSGLFCLSILFSFLLVIFFMVFGGQISKLALGFDPTRKELLAGASIWILPVVLLYIPRRQLGAILRSRRQFSPFYQAEFLTTLLVSVCVIIYYDKAEVLLWSLSIGTFVSFLFILKHTWHFIFPLRNPFSSVVLQSLRLAPALLLLLGAHYVYILSDRIFVSFLPEGGVSALAYAMTLVAFLPGLVTSARSLITVLLDQTRNENRSKYLNDLISFAIFFCMCAMFLILMLGESIIRVLLERGVFTVEDTKNVGIGFVAYAGIVLPLFLIAQLDQVFQVENKIGVLVKRAILGMVCNIVLNSFFLFVLGWGLFGVAFATTISYWIMLLTSLLSLKDIGYSVNWYKHLLWAMWLLVSQSIAFVMFVIVSSLVRNDFILIPLGLAISTISLISFAYFYRGEEGLLVRNTISRVRASY